MFRVSMTDFRPWTLDLWCVLAFFAAAALLCHRMYGTGDYRLEGDAVHNVYFELNPDIVQSGYDPYAGDYFASMPHTGRYNILLVLARGIIGALSAGKDKMRDALYTDMVAGWLSISFLSSAVFFFLRLTGRSRWASSFGGLVGAYTNCFATSTPNNFNYVFPTSFLGVMPLFWCLLRLCQGKSRKAKAGWAIGSALCIGISLLGGTNAPMFMYLPILFSMPLVSYIFRDSNARTLVENMAWQAGALILGILIAGPVMFPNLLYYPYILRSGIKFVPDPSPGVPSIGILPTNSISALVLKWMKDTSGFLPMLPTVILTIAGLSRSWMDLGRNRGSETRDWKDSRLLFTVMTFCMAGGIVIPYFPMLPGFIRRLLAAFFEVLSIRFPYRFEALLLLPRAYFSAYGFDHMRGLWFLRLSLFIIALNLIYMGWSAS